MAVLLIYDLTDVICIAFARKCVPALMVIFVSVELNWQIFPGDPSRTVLWGLWLRNTLL